MLTHCFDSSGMILDDEFNRLVRKFKKLIYAHAHRYYLPGGDVDDLYQWGLLGLYKAVLRYEENGKYDFDVIAIINIKNMMKSAIKTANRNKHKAANTACSLYHTGDDAVPENGIKLVDRLVLEEYVDDPLDLVTDKEAVSKIMNYIDTHLSYNERTIFKLYITGYKQRHISQELNFDPKVVDNAIQRARKKLCKHLQVLQSHSI